jgi:hypothetical protein
MQRKIVSFVSLEPQALYRIYALVAFRTDVKKHISVPQRHYCNGELLFRSASESCTFRIRCTGAFPRGNKESYTVTVV